MKNLRYLFVVATMHLTLHTQAQFKLNSTNLAHQYAPDAEINLSTRTESDEDQVTIHAMLTINQGKAQLYDFTMRLFTAASYADKADFIPLEKIDSVYKGSVRNNHFFTYRLPSAEVSEVIAIQVQSKFSGFSYYFDFPVSKNNLLLKDDQHIQYHNWVAPGSYTFNKHQQVFGYYYSSDFPPALPPMPVKNEAPEPSLSIDSTFVMADSAEIFLQKHGLYLFQLDSSTNIGLPLRVENRFFPRLAKLENLTEPLIYITTREENATLRNINGEKKKFDKFWLDLTNSPERAKNIIKNYFERVEQANYLFTTYKEGWKTDMGMIYIIFGPPDEVTRNENGETWGYLASPVLPKTTFSFIRSESIFGINHGLIRDKRYTNTWYRAVDLWRKGRF